MIPALGAKSSVLPDDWVAGGSAADDGYLPL